MVALKSALSFPVASTTDQHLSGAVININTTGDNIIVAAVAGQGVYVYKILLVVNAAVSITFKDGAGTALTGAISLIANEAIVLTFDTRPWFECSVGNAFIMNLSGNVQVSGRAYYLQV